ncbi:hypothetical protein B0H19DRAFT_1277737 [Mycena capillaripes]|nr:hypothetical protein B0H19DRAFT_1277737 [Mycena capillaripes]
MSQNPTRDVKNKCKYVKPYIAANPPLCVDTAWIASRHYGRSRGPDSERHIKYRRHRSAFGPVGIRKLCHEGFDFGINSFSGHPLYDFFGLDTNPGKASEHGGVESFSNFNLSLLLKKLPTHRIHPQRCSFEPDDPSSSVPVQVERAKRDEVGQQTQPYDIDTRRHDRGHGAAAKKIKSFKSNTLTASEIHPVDCLS